MTDSKIMLGRLVEQFYEGVLSDEGWGNALKLVTSIMKAPQASVIIRTRYGFAISEHFSVPDDVFADYNAYYHKLDPALSIADRLASGAWYHDRRDIGEDMLKHDEFYNDFMLKRGYASVTSNHVLCGDGTSAFLSMQRMIGQPDFTQQDRRALEPALPHIRRAIRLRLRLQSLAGQAALGAMVLDRLRTPLLVVDERGCILMANADAEAVMRRKPALSTVDGCLAARSVRKENLEKLFRGACGVDGPVVAGAMRIVNDRCEAILQIVVTPLPARVTLFNAWQRPLALVLLHDPDIPRSPREDLLQQLYGLTPAEARVAAAISSGASPITAASTLRLSVETVRTQWKAVRLKTGASRQSELTLMLSALLALQD